MEKRSHLFPFRTQKLSSSSPKVLCLVHGRIGRRRISLSGIRPIGGIPFFFFAFTGKNPAPTARSRREIGRIQKTLLTKLPKSGIMKLKFRQRASRLPKRNFDRRKAGGDRIATAGGKTPQDGDLQKKSAGASAGGRAEFAWRTEEKTRKIRRASGGS